MVDLVTSQQVFNGPRHLVYRFTNLSDGTGETGVTKVDATNAATNGWVYYSQSVAPGVHLKILRVRYDIKGMGVRIQFHATSNADALILGGFGIHDFKDTGGLQNPGTVALAGSTGSIDFTTVGAASGNSYFIELEMTKGVPQF
jgi:hypothetical protein